MHHSELDDFILTTDSKEEKRTGERKGGVRKQERGR
jgi:hypothetical protein